jgi:hypothetical protein
MFVNLKIPQLNAQLPKSDPRSLISLSDNSDVEVAQPLTAPRSSGGESLPWRMKFNLGGDVKITRSDLLLPLSGAPEIQLGDALKVSGDVELTPGGRLSLFGLPRPFTIESGTVSFDSDGDPGDPRISVQAICEAAQVTVRAKVTGTLNNADVVLEDVDDSTVTDTATILAKLMNNSADDTSSANGAPAGLGVGVVSTQLLANTALSNLQIKAGNETTADHSSYQTYSAAYPILDNVWFEGSYKTLQGDPSGANATNAWSGTFDWRFRRNWSMRFELGNIGTGTDLLWQYKY